MTKKSFPFILLCLLLTQYVFSQRSFYFGYENGIKFDQFSYFNSVGNSHSDYQLDGVLGGYVGYYFNTFTIETGYYKYFTSSPVLRYNYSTKKLDPNDGNGSHGSSAMNSTVIPLRFGKEFLFLNKKVFVKPEIGFSAIIGRGDCGAASSWGSNVDFDNNHEMIPGEGNSTIGHGFRTQKTNFGFTTGISAGLKIKQRLDIYMKGNFDTSLKPLYFENITHYSPDGNVTATNSFNGTAFSWEIGLRFYLKKLK